MKDSTLIRKLVVFFFFCFVIIPTYCNAADQIGIVLLHGKTGGPKFFWNTAYGATAHDLKEAGFLVETPELPWSKKRYLDKTFEEALDEIDLAVNHLREKGATKIVVAGHSMGGNASIAYAAYHGAVDAVVALAPGHNPEVFNYNRADLGKAKTMMNAGKGDMISSFIDGMDGVTNQTSMKASVYYSFFDPQGTAAMSKSAKLINSNIPVLYVVGSQDPLTVSRGKGYAFDKLPRNSLTRYVTVNANHMGTPALSVSIIIDWLNELARQ